MWGLDYLAGAKYPDLILREHPAGWAAGFFFDTFGDSTRVIDELCKTGRCPAVRVHLAWKDDHRFPSSEFVSIARKGRKIEALARKYSKVKFYVSPACEPTGVSTSDAVKFCKLVQNEAPSCTVVWVGNPIPGFKNEKHGPYPSGKFSITSVDNNVAGIVDLDAEKWKGLAKSAEIAFFWDPRFNGRRETNDVTERSRRNDFPDSPLIDSIIFLHMDRGKTGELPKGWIYKSHAENSEGYNPREEHPCLITPIKDKRAEFVVPNGQVIGTLEYFGTYSGGGYRYYASAWGYQLAEKARRISGKPLAHIRINGKLFGPINPGFRAGSFR